MKYHITLDEKNPQIKEIDLLTEKLTFRLSGKKKRKLFEFAKQNHSTVSELVRQVIEAETIERMNNK